MGVQVKTIKRKPAKSRDAKGRFVPGRSGNPGGRPKKPRELPKLLPEQFAAVLAETVTIIGSDGKKRKVTRYEKWVRDILDGASSMKPKEQFDLLLKMKTAGAIDVMREEAEEPAEDPWTEEDRRILLAIIDDDES